MCRLITIIKKYVLPLLGLSCFSMYVQCEEMRHDDALFFYADAAFNKENNFHNMELVPISLMDNKSLFLAADEEKYSAVSHSQRLFNNLWIASSSRNTYSGIRAVRKVCARGFKSLFNITRNNFRKFEPSFASSPRPKVKPKKKLALFQLNNYDLAISETRVALKFEHRFSLHDL